MHHAGQDFILSGRSVAGIEQHRACLLYTSHHFPNGDFSEAAHRDCCGETGIIEILRAYHDCGFEGYIRPDHGRQLWEEGPGSCRPGYGKYDLSLIHIS